MPYRRHSSPSLLLNLPLLILLLSVVVFLLFFFAISSSSSSHAKLRPATVKKSWDSLNVFLILFAVLCGIFARKNDDDHSAPADDAHNFNRNVLRLKEERHTVSNNWFDQFTVATPATGGMRRLKRSSSSYPDLRNESFWESGDDRSRFFDDFEISKYRSSSSLSGYVYDRRQRSVFEESVDVKEIPVDTCVLRSSLQSPSPPLPKSPTPPPPLPPPPPPPSATSNQKQKRFFKTVQRKEKIEKPDENEYEFSRKGNSPPKPPPPPPPPPPVNKATRSERKHWSKKTNATKELKMALISLYHQSKRKKQQKTRSLYDDTLQSPPELPSFLVPPPSPPPPPPPPPPPTVFRSLFRKGSKNKRIHSFSAPPPPPPPPPPPRQSFSTLKRWSKRKGQISHPPPPPPPAPVTPPQAPFRRRNNTITTGRPPLPTKANNFYDENVNIVGKSTLIPMPPPPPLPPFKVPGFKFMIKGDYVKIRSGQSSRCSSPEFEEVDKRSTETVNMMKSEEARGGSLFCPSPDVNAKADSFIARLRDEWRLEKINSM